MDPLNKAIRAACGFPSSLGIEWLSPLRDDEYAEYRDADFLSVLQIELHSRPLELFWPPRGPQWDGLARTSDGGVLLIEAKANVPEVISPGTRASGSSRRLIEQSLDETKAYLGVGEDISWSGKLYQYSNRLAHLYLLRVLNNIDAHIIFLYFTGAKDVTGPETVAEWKAAVTVAKGVLGVGSRHKLGQYVLDVFHEVPGARNAA